MKTYKHRRLAKCTIYQQVYEFIGKCRMLVGILKYQPLLYIRSWQISIMILILYLSDIHEKI